jgi:maltooligosyltrehalose trehalohydrolase
MKLQTAAATNSLGAVPGDDGHTTFRVWAPNARRVRVLVGDDSPNGTANGAEHDLGAAEGGLWVARVPAAPGTRYAYVLDDDEPRPDPCSSAQPDGVLGWSEVVDHAAFRWTDAAWRGVLLPDLVIYELHVGTFTTAGTLLGARSHLPGLRELGITAVEIMPVATFPGNRGWGYDGLYTSAPHPAYGGPAALAEFVDAAHAEGIAVLLDVVYNHIGPGSEALAAFGPYFTHRHETFWGDAIDYSQPYVREWAIQNAEHWVRDFHVDGLRLDATHAVFDDSEPHVLAELAERVRTVRPSTIVISEMETGDERPIRAWRHDAQWGDELHHAAHVLITGEHDAYYADYGTVADVAGEFVRPHAAAMVVCAQNHDQVGNRAFGDRLRGRELRLAAFCSILAPGIPLLFMGEEYDESHPFQFFTDHIDPEIARATRDGRRREFSAFSAFSGEDIPDPQDPETFERSKLDPTGGDPAHRRYYRELLELRRRLRGWPVDAVHADEERLLLTVRRGPVELVMNFSDTDHDGVAAMTGVVRDDRRLAG